MICAAVRQQVVAHGAGVSVRPVVEQSVVRGAEPVAADPVLLDAGCVGDPGIGGEGRDVVQRRDLALEDPLESAAGEAHGAAVLTDHPQRAMVVKVQRDDRVVGQPVGPGEQFVRPVPVAQ